MASIPREKDNRNHPGGGPNDNQKAEEKENENQKDGTGDFKKGNEKRSEKGEKKLYGTKAGQEYGKSIGRDPENKTTTETERAHLEGNDKRVMDELDGKMMEANEKFQQIRTMLTLDVHDVFARGGNSEFIHGEGFRKKGLRMKTAQKATDVSGIALAELGNAISGGYAKGQSLLHRR